MNLMEKILLKLFRHTDIVKKVDGKDELYLRRFFIFSRRWGGIYLHKICRPDDDPDPHNHPWSFITLILSGGYWDESWVIGGGTGLFWRKKQPLKYCAPGGFYSRKAEHIHRVRLIKKDDGSYRHAWTLVFRGRIRRKWEFITETGPVYWRKYLNVWDADTNEGGVQAQEP